MCLATAGFLAVVSLVSRAYTMLRLRILAVHLMRQSMLGTGRVVVLLFRPKVPLSVKDRVLFVLLAVCRFRFSSGFMRGPPWSSMSLSVVNIAWPV